MNKNSLRFIIYIVGFLIATSCYSDELTDRQLLANQSKALLERGDLATLDQLATEFRVARARTPAGGWKLSMYYSGLKSALPSKPSDPAWIDLEHVTQQWQAAHPLSPAAVVIAAYVIDKHAWAYRGRGSYSDIPKENLELVADYAERTRKLLDDNKAVGKTDPEWYSLRIGLDRLLDAGRTDIFELLQDALRQESSFYDTQTAAFYGLLPRWGGDKRSIERLFNLTRKKARAEEGDQSYGRVYFNFADRSGDMRKDFDEAGFDWARFKASLREISVAYPDPHNLNIERAMACVFGQVADYKEAVARLTEPRQKVGSFDTESWQADCEDWAFKGKTFTAPEPQGFFDFVPIIGHQGALLVLIVFGTLAFALAAITQRLFPQSANTLSPPPTIVFPEPQSDQGDHWYRTSTHAISTATFPRTYWISPGWQFLTLMVGAVMTIGACLLLVKSWGDTAGHLRPASSLVLIALGCAVFGVYFLASSRRCAIVLHADSIETRGIFSRRSLTRAEIAGRRLLKARNAPPTTIVVPKIKGVRPIKIQSVYQFDTVLKEWIAMLPDLDQQEQLASKAEILANPIFGETVIVRQDRLIRATRFAKGANIAGAVIAAWGFIWPYPIAMCVAFLLGAPCLAMGLVLQSKGLYRLDGKPTDARPMLAGLFYLPALVLGLRGLLDVNLLDWRIGAVWAVMVGVIVAGIFLSVSRRETRTGIVALAVLIVACIASYGGIVETDQIADDSNPQTFHTQVVAKYVTTGKHKSWDLTLAPWGPQQKSASVSVKPELYQSVSVGSPICVELMQGSLALPWYELARC